jgi:hypothetical protein
MLVTDQGFLAINTPKGWERADGPGLAYFVLGEGAKDNRVCDLYQFRAGRPKEETKDVKAYIGFKQEFKSGVVQQEAPLNLPQAKLQALVYTFRSGDRTAEA